tara:strand:- start:873 stop:1268 length:396 start_codon:yes stop_codon:yes gene_type:complete
MKVTVKQLAKMLMEEKTVLATHPGGEEGTEGYEKDVLSRSWGDDEEADPKLDFVDEARFSEIAGLPLKEGSNYALDRALADMSFKLEDEINAVVSREVSGEWWRDPEALGAVMEMLDNLKKTFDKYAHGGL